MLPAAFLSRRISMSLKYWLDITIKDVSSFFHTMESYIKGFIERVKCARLKMWL